jgi:hypothetical protein
MKGVLLVFSASKFKTNTCNECVCLSDSISKMDTTLSEAAASSCPILGWNLTCVVPPYSIKCPKFRIEKEFKSSELQEQKKKYIHVKDLHG